MVAWFSRSRNNCNFCNGIIIDRLLYYINVGMNLALSQGASEKIIAYYDSSRQWAMYGAIVLYVIGLLLTAGGGLKVLSIIRRTTHDEY